VVLLLTKQHTHKRSVCQAVLKVFFALLYVIYSMDFVNSIQTIQQKPRHIRRRILFVSVTVCMAIVIAVWLMVTNRRIDTDMFTAPNIKTHTETAASPFDMLKDIFTDGLESIRAQF